MGAGAYTVDLNPVSWPPPVVGTTLRQVVPLTPALNSGAVKYTDVFLSLAAATATSAAITILTQTGSVSLGNLNVGPGRTGIGRKVEAGDLAADITFKPTVAPQPVVALVEYSAPNAGACAVDLNPFSWDVGVGRTLRQVVPLTPALNSGTVKYTDVFLSLAAATATSAAITILTQTGSVPLGNLNVGPGRTGIGRKIQAGDLAADITFKTTVIPQPVVALIEFSTL